MLSLSPVKSKDIAVRCWQRVSAESGVDDKVLAAECGWSPGHYSKVATGVQGDLIDLVYRLPAHRSRLRATFFLRLSESEQADPLMQAGEQVIDLMSRFLRLCAEYGFPAERVHDDQARKAG